MAPDDPDIASVNSAKSKPRQDRFTRSGGRPPRMMHPASAGEPNPKHPTPAIPCPVGTGPAGCRTRSGYQVAGTSQTAVPQLNQPYSMHLHQSTSVYLGEVHQPRGHVTSIAEGSVRATVRSREPRPAAPWRSTGPVTVSDLSAARVAFDVPDVFLHRYGG
jgi:hypothetical protein